MMPHQRERQQHLRSEPPNEIGRKAHKAVGLDQLVEVNAQEFHGNAKMVPEVKVLDHLRDMVLLLRVLE
jgi:hypothetical protein